MIKTSKLFIIIFILTFFSNQNIFSQHRFIVDLNERDEDLFYVALYPENLTPSNRVYNFAATAPGAYQRMNIGRFVKSFQAFDKNEEEIETKQVSINRWEISEPEKVNKIYYQVADIIDTPVEKDFIYSMCASTLEDDHALINGHCVFGYFDEMQSHPLDIKLKQPEEWIVGTALDKNEEGYYTATSFDHVVDSPILTGRMTEVSIDVSGTKVEVFTYSKADLVKSEDLLNSIEDILFAAEKFLEELPVDRYSFLFHFEDVTGGAWEHSYSSIYTYTDTPLTEGVIKNLRSTVAHEFFHIVTPLNIHSELVSPFNFAEPRLSKHIWFYESVTEWASDIMQLRADIYTIDDYIGEIRQKLVIGDNLNQEISLTELAVNSFDMQNQFYTFYSTGAVIMSMLDLKLLELSNGERGLREVVNELAKDYGPDRAFSEEKFFDEFVNRTYPEIREFFDNYVINRNELPLEEKFGFVGIHYDEFSGYDSTGISFGFGLGVEGENVVITTLEDETLPVEVNDIIHKYEGEEIELQKNGSRIFTEINRKKAGDVINLTLLRDGEEVEFKHSLPPKKIKHVFSVMEDLTEKQAKLREAWMKNL